MDKQETLQAIPGFCRYSITKDGRVFSHCKKRFLKPSYDRDGYVFVKLLTNNKRFNKRVHRLVMATFCGSSDLQINHINCIKTDNRLENLEYCTQSENVRHAHANGCYPATRTTKQIAGYKKGATKRRGKSLWKLRKLTVDNVRAIRQSDLTSRQLAAIYGVGKTTIVSIKAGKTYTDVNERIRANIKII